VKTTDTPESPGPSYALDSVNIDEHGRMRFLWKRSCLRVALLLIAAGVVAGVIAWGCCH
jgi:hypothetical protein